MPATPAAEHRLHAGTEAAEHINLAGVDFLSLRLVVLCAELGSLSLAARHANMSLSCASHRLSVIEERFGARFFERDYRGMQLTRAGELFVSHARAVLDIFRRGLRQLEALPVAGIGPARVFVLPALEARG